jgi:GNAT superfamily N-acetyltransferase
MPGLEIRPVAARRDRRAFIAFPYDLHRGDPCWTPPLRRDVNTLLDPDQNPFFRHGAAQHFLARRGGVVLGRVSAIENRLHNETHGDRVGFFGFFETVDDPEVAGALLDAAALWVKGRGLDVLRGPASFSTNDEAGLLVDGFSTPATVMMSHHPPFYARLLEGAGFVKAKDLLVYERVSANFPDRLKEGTDALRRRYKIHIRQLDMRHFEAEVERVKKLYNLAWEKNWGFVAMTDAEIDFLARQLKPVVVPEMVGFAEKEGQLIGFVVGLPDLNVALRANPSGRLFPGIFKVLWAARRIDRARVLLLGILPEWRGKGFDALLYRWVWEQALAKGIRWGEAGWILEDNHAMRNGLTRMGFKVYKTYRMYDRAV